MADFDNTPAVPVACVHEPWAPARAVLTSEGANPTTIMAGDLVDGVSLTEGDRFLCVGTRPDAGVYTVGTLASARSADANTASAFLSSRTVRVIEGGASNAGTWRLQVGGSVELGTTPLTFSRVVATAADLPAAAAFDHTPPGTIALGS